MCELDYLDRLEEAEDYLNARLEKGGLGEFVDEITYTLSDMNEFEANLWAYIKEDRKAVRFICEKYLAFKDMPTVKCTCCGVETNTYKPDPRDSKQAMMVCIDCEYAITESISAEPTDLSLCYKEAHHGY